MLEGMREKRKYKARNGDQECWHEGGGVSGRRAFQAKETVQVH